jgi:hypothetical protein
MVNQVEADTELNIYILDQLRTVWKLIETEWKEASKRPENINRVDLFYINFGRALERDINWYKSPEGDPFLNYFLSEREIE